MKHPARSATATAATSPFRSFSIHFGTSQPVPLEPATTCFARVLHRSKQDFNPLGIIFVQLTWSGCSKGKQQVACLLMSCPFFGRLLGPTNTQCWTLILKQSDTWLEMFSMPPPVIPLLQAFSSLKLTTSILYWPCRFTYAWLMCHHVR